MNTDIVLVDSLSYSNIGIKPQIGLLSLRQVLEREYKVELVNFDFLWANAILALSEDLEENLCNCADYIMKFQAKVIGFYTICDSYPISVLLAKRIKERNENVIILFGGPQASLTAVDSLESFFFVDYICIGEGERVINPLLKAIIKGKVHEVKKIPNLAYRDRGEIKCNPLLPMITSQELSGYTVTNYQPFEKFFKDSMSIEVGRGCPFSCTFCSTSLFWGHCFRMKSIDELIFEMKYFHEKFHVSEFKFEHDMFTQNRDYIMSFCNRIIEEKLPYTWTCSSRVDVLDDEIITLLSKAKCTKMYIGIESGSPFIQRVIHKNLDMEKVKQNIVLLHQSGIEVTASFIYGFPEEKVEHLKETLEMISYFYLHGIFNIQLHMFIPLPKTDELLKVEEQLVFDKNKIDLGIYHSGIAEKETQELISSFPKVFSQFYTFPSEVRDSNVSLSLFIMYISNSYKIFQCCIKYFIRIYGLYELYRKWYQDFEQLRLETTLNQESKKFEDKYLQLNTFMYQCISNEIKGLADQEIKNYFDAEVQLYKFSLSKKLVEAFEFKFDYFEAINHNIYIEKEFFFIMRKN